MIKNDNSKAIVDDFGKHLLTHHDQYYPARELFGFIKNQKSGQNNNSKSNSMKNDELVRLEKWFPGRKNFP
jgi:hypothetical protein